MQIYGIYSYFTIAPIKNAIRRPTLRAKGVIEPIRPRMLN